MSAEQIMSNAGIANAQHIIRAANDTGLPLGIAVALIVKESSGQNIYGHDAGGAMWGRGVVTRENFLNEFLPAVLAGHVSNGVGPCQITYPGYFKQNRDYPFWDVYSNCCFGFRIMNGYLHGDYTWQNLYAAGARYNSGSPTGAPAYGNSFADLACSWTDRLSGHDTNISKPKPRMYRVEPGDNLTWIAEHFGVTVAAIVDANNIANPDHIEVGWELIIP